MEINEKERCKSYSRQAYHWGNLRDSSKKKPDDTLEKGRYVHELKE
jgi:hypothetical protein